jgi:hypothetical protein
MYNTITYRIRQHFVCSNNAARQLCCVVKGFMYTSVMPNFITLSPTLCSEDILMPRTLPWSPVQNPE